MVKKTFGYKRVGRCDPSKCGAFCCRVQIIIDAGQVNCKKDFNYYFDHGFKKIKVDKGMTALFLLGDCKHLTNKLSCGVWKKRPPICKNFPEDKGMGFYKVAKKFGCTYRFKRVKRK